MDSFLKALLVIVAILLGFYAVDYYFVPAHLTVCIAKDEQVDTVMIRSWWGEVRQMPNSNREVLFQNARKGWWQIFYENGEARTEKAEIFVDGYHVWLNCPSKSR